MMKIFSVAVAMNYEQSSEAKELLFIIQSTDFRMFEKLMMMKKRRKGKEGESEIHLETLIVII